MKSASAVTPETRFAGRSTRRWSAQKASACPPTSRPRGEQMLKIFCTSSRVSGASVSRSLFIETAGATQHPRATCALGRNHVRLAPLAVLRRFPRGQSGAERARGQHYRNEPPVLHDVHTPQGRDVLEKATKIVLRVASGYTLRH